MFAVIKTGGKQYRVSAGDEFAVEKLAGETGDKIEFNEVLMLGFMNPEAFEKTKETGKVTFWSRTRNQLWTKGETSGNFLLVKQILVDCDKDTLLVKAEPKGPTCHTGEKTCFFEELK